MQAVPISGLWLCHRKQIVDYLPAASCHSQFVLSTEITLFWTSQSPHCCEKVVCLLNILFTIWLAAKHRTYLRANSAPDHHIPTLKRPLASPGWHQQSLTQVLCYLRGFGKEGSVLCSSWRSFLSLYPGIRVAPRNFPKRRGLFFLSP